MTEFRQDGETKKKTVLSALGGKKTEEGATLGGARLTIESGPLFAIGIISSVASAVLTVQPLSAASKMVVLSIVTSPLALTTSLPKGSVIATTASRPL